MSLRKETPCDFGECPYDAESHSQCEYWCGEEEPEEVIEEDEFWAPSDDKYQDLDPAVFDLDNFF